MKLSKLVYLCIKNVFYINDGNFLYQNFLAGDFDDDPDYDTNIVNVFSPVNEAIARLNDLERIPYMVEEATFNEDGSIDISELNVKEVVSVGLFKNGEPTKLAHKVIRDRVFITEVYDKTNKVYIEYKQDIPPFDREDIPTKNVETNELYDENDENYHDVDLKKDYAISDSLCNYIIEYVQGKLQEPIAPELANMHITRAEAYFSNTKPVSALFVQRLIKKVNTIEG